MIQGLSKKITEYMFAMNVCTDNFEIHRYGIEVIISTVIDFMFIMIIGFVMNHLADALIYYFAFLIIRKFSGGYHCQTYFYCISLHVLLFIVYLMTFQYYSQWMPYIHTFAIFIFLTLSPVKNRESNENEHIKYKIISLIILIVFIVISNFGFYENIFTYVVLIVSILIIACIRNYES